MPDRYWRGGSGTWNGTNTANWAATVSGGTGALPPTSSDNVIFDANSNTGTAAFTVTISTVTAVCADFTATGIDGTMTLAGSASLTIYGSLALPATLFTRTFIGVLTFAATTTGKTINANGKTFATGVVFDGVGGGWTLSNAFTCLNSTTLTNGTLDLGGFTLSTLSFASSNTNTRSIAFNGGSIAITGNSNAGNITLWSCSTLTGFTLTGTPTVNVPNTSTSSSFTRSFNHGTTVGSSETNAITLNVQAGDNGNLLSVNGAYLNLNFTGCSSTLNNGSRTIYGDLTLSSTMAANGGASVTSFGSTSATVRNINTNGVNLDCPFSFAGGTGSYQLQSALTTGSTRSITLQSGTFNSNNYNITCGILNYNNTNTKSITFGTSTITIAGGTSTTGFVGSSSNTTYSMLNATVLFTNTGTYYNGSTVSGNQVGVVTMAASGGTLYLGIGLTGARCTTLSNTPGQPCTITNTCTSSFVVTNFAVTGSSGNIVNINSDTAGTARTISQTSGTIDTAYLTIQDSIATGGATWNAYNSTNTSNNTGWNFVIAKTTAVYTATGTFTVPAGVSSITVEAIGGGGSSSYNEPFGAGGGAYAKSNSITVTAGNTVYINIGAHADSWVNTSNTAPTSGVTPTTQAVLAKAGTAGTSTGLGGQASLSIGDIKYSGGNGGTSKRIDAFSQYGLGGSGGAAGPNGAGGNGGDAYTSTSFANTGGGGGGAGAFSSSANSNGGAGYVPRLYNVGGNGGSSAAGILGAIALAGSTGSNGANGGGGSGGGYDTSLDTAYTGGKGSTATVPLWSLGGTLYGPGSGAGGGSASAISQQISGTGGNYGGGGTGGTSGLVVITYTSSGSSIDVSITEAASGIDSILAQIIAASAINENAAGLDSLTTTATLNLALSEAASGLDALTTTATFNLALSEAASGLDASTTTAIFNLALSEAASGLDALTTTATLNLALSEAASGVDSDSAGLSLVGTILEAASGVDSDSAGLSLVGTILEAASGLDAITKTATLSAAIAEAASGLDATSLQLKISLSISEAASSIDSLSARSLFVASILEAVSGQDTLATQLQAINAILESASGVDGTAATAVLNIAIVESATGSAVSDASFLWNLINDAQSAGWTPLDSSQTVNWTPVSNAQTVTWVIVNTNPNAT